MLRDIAHMAVPPSEKKILLIEGIRKQKPINNHILNEIPKEMEAFWSQTFIQQFLDDFGKGAPIPTGFDAMAAKGTPKWDRHKLEDSFKRRIKEKDNFDLVHKDRCKNASRKLLFGPVRFETLEKLFSWVERHSIIPERMVFDPKFRSCFDFSREWNNDKSPNKLIPYRYSRIVGTSLQDIAAAALTGEFGAGFDVVSAFRNILAAPEWWPYQILPVWMPVKKEIWWAMAPTVEFGKRNAASIWTAAYKTFFAYWDHLVGYPIAVLPVNRCRTFRLPVRTIIPSSVKWHHELRALVPEPAEIDDNVASELWNESLTQLLGTDIYHNFFSRQFPGNTMKNTATIRNLPMVPFYRACDDFNKVVSEWRKGGSRITARTTTIDDTLIFSNDMQALREAHLQFLECHKHSHLGIDFSKTTITPLTKVEMIGYEVDFKNKTLRIKEKKLKKYDLFWKEVSDARMITVEKWATITGRLLFAASLSAWRMKDLEPWLQAILPIYSKNKGTYTLDHIIYKNLWEKVKNERLELNDEMRRSATEVFRKAHIPTPAISVLLQPYDGGARCTAMTDASFQAMGGCSFSQSPRPWSVTYQTSKISHRVQSLGGIPLPRRWKSGMRKRMKSANPHLSQYHSYTELHIGAAEFLALCIQLQFLLNDRVQHKAPQKLFTMLVDNTSVAWALVKKRSQFYTPFIDWIEHKIRPLGFDICATRIGTHEFPADLLSRPDDFEIDWPLFLDWSKKLAGKDIHDAFGEAKKWKSKHCKIREDSIAVAEKVWFEINSFARRGRYWQYLAIF